MSASPPPIVHSLPSASSIPSSPDASGTSPPTSRRTSTAMSGGDGTNPSTGTGSTRKRATYGRKLDDFGFILDDSGCVGSRSVGGVANNPKVLNKARSENAIQEGHRPSNRENPARAVSTSVLAKRERKWSKMMDDWPGSDRANGGKGKFMAIASKSKSVNRRKKKLKRRIRKGVPHSVRGEVWCRLADVPNRIEVTAVGKYEELMRKSGQIAIENEIREKNSTGDYHDDDNGVKVDQEADRNRATSRSTRETIERDINRTFPRHYLFADSSDDESSDDEEDNIGEDDGPIVWNNDRLVEAARAMQATNEDGGAEFVAELNAMLGPVGPGTEKTSNGGNGGADDAKKAIPFHMSNAVIPEHKELPSTMKKKLFHAMQQCNATLDQVDLEKLDLDLDQKDREEGNAFLVDSKEVAAFTGKGATSNTENVQNEAADEAAGPNSNHSSPAKSTSDSTAAQRVLKRKLTREEKRELKKADYAGARGGQASLRRVLRAYSVYDPSVGYCQGMNFIAAMFISITHKEDEDGIDGEEESTAVQHQEEEAFWLLATVMNEAPFQCRELFGEGMSGAHRVLYVAEKLIGQFLPKLSHHLEKENIHITMFATQWLLTLYTSSFPFELVTRVWDCFLSEGWKIVYRVMLAILDGAAADLMKLHFEEILGHFRDLPRTVDGEVIFAKVFDIPLKRRHIEKYEQEWAAQQGSS